MAGWGISRYLEHVERQKRRHRKMLEKDHDHSWS